MISDMLTRLNSVLIWCSLCFKSARRGTTFALIVHRRNFLWSWNASKNHLRNIRLWFHSGWNCGNSRRAKEQNSLFKITRRNWRLGKWNESKFSDEFQWTLAQGNFQDGHWKKWSSNVPSDHTGIWDEMQLLFAHVSCWWRFIQ